MMDFSKTDILRERQSYNKNNKINCLFVGRIESRKGVYELVQAIEILNKKRDDMTFTFVGGGQSFDELVLRFANSNNVFFLGNISNKEKLLSIYRGADLFIFPSHDEGFPRVLYEAMMAKIPIITTLVGGIGGLMKDNYNCKVINVRDPESIVQKVEELVSSKTLQKRLVEQATKDILEVFDGSRKEHSELLLSNLKKEGVC